MPARHSWNDQQIDTIIGNILRIGVAAAALIVALGGVLYLIGHGASPPAYHMFRGEPGNLRHLAGIAETALRAHGRGLIQLGLVLLIATPIIRVAFTCIAFALQKDRAYVWVTLIVFSLLLYSLIDGK